MITKLCKMYCSLWANLQGCNLTYTFALFFVLLQATFTLLLGPFTFFSAQKTKYLQILTSLMRWIGKFTQRRRLIYVWGTVKMYCHIIFKIHFKIERGVNIFFFSLQPVKANTITSALCERWGGLWRLFRLVCTVYTILKSKFFPRHVAA